MSAHLECLALLLKQQENLRGSQLESTPQHCSLPR